MSQATKAPTATPTTVIPCPRCESPLIDPFGLGWCKACGFCRSLADGEKKVQKPAAPPTALVVTGSAIGQTPAWFVVTLLGIGAIVGGTFACTQAIQLTEFQRALLTTVEIAAGVVFMLFGQFIGLMRIAPEDSTLSFWDAVFPFRLYGLVMKRLPSTQITLYLGAWGFTAILAAGILVGGLGHWLTYLPGQKNQVQKVRTPGL